MCIKFPTRFIKFTPFFLNKNQSNNAVPTNPVNRGDVPCAVPFLEPCVRKFKEEGACEENLRELAESAAEEYVAVMESN